MEMDDIEEEDEKLSYRNIREISVQVSFMHPIALDPGIFIFICITYIYTLYMSVSINIQCEQICYYTSCYNTHYYSVSSIITVSSEPAFLFLEKASYSLICIMKVHIEFNQNLKTELLNQIICESVLMKILNEHQTYRAELLIIRN